MNNSNLIVGTTIFVISTLVDICNLHSGKITFNEFKVNMVGKIVNIGSGFGGSCLGAFICSPFGTVGIAIGGIVGGFVASYISETLCHKLIDQIFRKKPEDQIDEAFQFFGKTRDDPLKEVRIKYKQLMRKFHPDNGSEPNKEMASKANLYLGIINAHIILKNNK
jgi:hypothetical protein